jgi:hypothetical protein
MILKRRLERPSKKPQESLPAKPAKQIIRHTV